MTSENNRDAPPDDRPQSLIDHLVELRNRLLHAGGAVLIIFAGLFYFANDIYAFISAPLRELMPEGVSMIATEVASPFLTPFKLTLVSAFLIAAPYWLHQAWCFIAPGLYGKEKRFVAPLLITSIFLFYGGMAFAYWTVLPLAFAFFHAVSPEGVMVMTDINHYFSFVLKIFFAFGIAFEIPIATVLLIKTGWTTPKKLAAKRPYIIVGCFATGMLLTPPDIISQVLLAIPVWLLFEIGVLYGRFIVREKHKKTDKAVTEKATEK